MDNKKILQGISMENHDFLVDLVNDCVGRLALNAQLMPEVNEVELEQWLVGLSFINPAYFFTAPYLESFSKEIFSEPVKRDFTLNATSIFLFTLKAINIELEDILEIVLDSVVNISPLEQGHLNLVPNEYIAFLQIDRGSLKKVLLSNRWLIVMFIVSQYIHRSEFFGKKIEALTASNTGG